MNNKFPIIDLSKPKEDASHNLKVAASETGLFYISNHGIDQNLILEVIDLAKEFFSLPLENKMLNYIGTSPSHSGYVPTTEKGIYGDEAEDRRYEAFDLSNEGGSLYDYKKGNIFSGSNSWPYIPKFKEKVSLYKSALESLSHYICELIEISLSLPEGFFSSKMKQPMSQLRLIHYLANNKKPSINNVNMGAHTDYELFTILHQQSKGIQSQILDGSWVDIPIIEGAFIVNVGDLLEVISGGVYKSNLHRVINTNAERFSIPFFASLDFDVIVQPVTNRESKYNSIHAGRHVIGQIIRDFPYLMKKVEKGELPFSHKDLVINPYENTVSHTLKEAI